MLLPKNGNLELVDNKKTQFLFATPYAGANGALLTISDNHNHSLTVTQGAHETVVKSSVSHRSLFFEWNSIHTRVLSVHTDPVDATKPTSVLTYSYRYDATNGSRLSQACDLCTTSAKDYCVTYDTGGQVMNWIHRASGKTLVRVDYDSGLGHTGRVVYASRRPARRPYRRERQPDRLALLVLRQRFGDDPPTAHDRRRSARSQDAVLPQHQRPDGLDQGPVRRLQTVRVRRRRSHQSQSGRIPLEVVRREWRDR